MKPTILQKTNHGPSGKSENWEYAVCPYCDGNHWRIIFSEECETSGQCVECGWETIVHDG